MVAPRIKADALWVAHTVSPMQVKPQRSGKDDMPDKRTIYLGEGKIMVLRTTKFLMLVSIALASTLASAQNCYKSTVLSPSPFMGNNGEIFKLSDGSVWEVKYEYEYMYEYSPSVIICPSRGKLIVGKKSLNVQSISGSSKRQSAPSSATAGGKWEVFEETSLQGSISGTVQMGRVFKTTSGNIYEVTGLTLQLVLELQPDVLVLRNGDTYKLVVKGFDEPLICRKLN